MAITKLVEKPPAMGGLFGKIALGAVSGPVRGLLPGGKPVAKAALPDITYVTAEQTVDRAALTAYQKVCGFKTSDVLPSTYIHVLAFPLQMAIMTEPDFPFAPLGMVHLENTLTQLRPVTADEKLIFTVTVANLRDHSAGQVMDFLLEAKVGDEVVLTGKSLYLKRGKSAASSGAAKPAAAKKKDDVPTGPASVWRFAEDTGRRYAAVSGDRNPIHLHALTAKALGFPKAIAHGMYSKARVLAAVENRIPDAYTIHAAFKTPILLPSTVKFAATKLDGGWDLDLRNARSDKPHLTGTIR